MEREAFEGDQVRVVIGVDESGTGAWAGPYFVCAAAAYAHDEEKLRRAGGRDSKKITDINRRASINAISDILLYACNVEVSVKEINARKKDAWRSSVVDSVSFVIDLLITHGIGKPSIDVVIDGLPDARTQRCLVERTGVLAKFLTAAEDQVPMVGAASVLAKTERNETMKKLHQQYPDYGWNKNYGYGTRQHADAVVRFGRSPEHRNIKFDVLRKEET